MSGIELSKLNNSESYLRHNDDWELNISNNDLPSYKGRKNIKHNIEGIGNLEAASHIEPAIQQARPETEVPLFNDLPIFDHLPHNSNVIEQQVPSFNNRIFSKWFTRGIVLGVVVSYAVHAMTNLLQSFNVMRANLPRDNFFANSSDHRNLYIDQNVLSTSMEFTNSYLEDLIGNDYLALNNKTAKWLCDTAKAQSLGSDCRKITNVQFSVKNTSSSGEWDPLINWFLGYNENFITASNNAFSSTFQYEDLFPVNNTNRLSEPKLINYTSAGDNLPMTFYYDMTGNSLNACGQDVVNVPVYNAISQQLENKALSYCREVNSAGEIVGQSMKYFEQIPYFPVTTVKPSTTTFSFPYYNLLKIKWLISKLPDSCSGDSCLYNLYFTCAVQQWNDNNLKDLNNTISGKQRCQVNSNNNDNTQIQTERLLAEGIIPQEFMIGSHDLPNDNINNIAYLLQDNPDKTLSNYNENPTYEPGAVLIHDVIPNITSYDNKNVVTLKDTNTWVLEISPGNITQISSQNITGLNLEKTTGFFFLDYDNGASSGSEASAAIANLLSSTGNFDSLDSTTKKSIQNINMAGARGSYLGQGLDPLYEANTGYFSDLHKDFLFWVCSTAFSKDINPTGKICPIRRQPVCNSSDNQNPMYCGDAAFSVTKQKMFVDPQPDAKGCLNGAELMGKNNCLINSSKDDYDNCVNQKIYNDLIATGSPGDPNSLPKLNEILYRIPNFDVWNGKLLAVTNNNNGVQESFVFAKDDEGKNLYLANRVSPFTKYVDYNMFNVGVLQFQENDKQVLELAIDPIIPINKMQYQFFVPSDYDGQNLWDFMAYDLRYYSFVGCLTPSTNDKTCFYTDYNGIPVNSEVITDGVILSSLNQNNYNVPLKLLDVNQNICEMYKITQQNNRMVIGCKDPISNNINYILGGDGLVQWYKLQEDNYRQYYILRNNVRINIAKSTGIKIDLSTYRLGKNPVQSVTMELESVSDMNKISGVFVQHNQTYNVEVFQSNVHNLRSNITYAENQILPSNNQSITFNIHSIYNNQDNIFVPFRIFAQPSTYQLFQCQISGTKDKLCAPIAKNTLLLPPNFASLIIPIKDGKVFNGTGSIYDYLASEYQKPVSQRDTNFYFAPDLGMPKTFFIDNSFKNESRLQCFTTYSPSFFDPNSDTPSMTQGGPTGSICTFPSSTASNGYSIKIPYVKGLNIDQNTAIQFSGDSLFDKSYTMDMITANVCIATTLIGYEEACNLITESGIIFTCYKAKEKERSVNGVSCMDSKKDLLSPNKYSIYKNDVLKNAFTSTITSVAPKDIIRMVFLLPNYAYNIHSNIIGSGEINFNRTQLVQELKDFSMDGLYWSFISGGLFTISLLIFLQQYHVRHKNISITKRTISHYQNSNGTHLKEAKYMDHESEKETSLNYSRKCGLSSEIIETILMTTMFIISEQKLNNMLNINILNDKYLDENYVHLEPGIKDNLLKFQMINPIVFSVSASIMLLKIITDFSILLNICNPPQSWLCCLCRYTRNKLSALTTYEPKFIGFTITSLFSLVNLGVGVYAYDYYNKNNSVNLRNV